MAQGWGQPKKRLGFHLSCLAQDDCFLEHMPMPKGYKILLSAYSCEPGKGSEPEVGWRWATTLARCHDVTVITRSNNRISITKALEDHPFLRPKFEYFDLPRAFVWLKKAGMPVPLYYLLWQISVRWHFRRRLKDFDIIHHITFNSFRQPGFWWFCNRPVVLGPLGGGQICPWRFFPLMRGRRLAELLRSISVILSPGLPQISASFGAASRILVANADTEKRIPRMFRHKVIRMLETGIDPGLIRTRTDSNSHTNEVRVLWFSWMNHIKAPELAVRAFAQACKSNPSLRLTMAGDGPLRAQVQSIAQNLGIADRIEWKGRVPRGEVPRMMEQHDIFVFTSLRDTSGNVLLEAMAAGLPCVTLLHQGAAEIAVDETALRVNVSSISCTTSNIAAALNRLAANSDLRRSLGKAAQQRIVDLFTWETKSAQASSIYACLSNERTQYGKVNDL